MRSLKPFTKATANLLATLLLPVLLSACASVGGKPASGSGSSDQNGPIGADGAVESSAVGVAEMPMPMVKGGNDSEFDAAVAFIQEGRYADAEILLLELTADQPELAGPWINLGQVYVALTQPDEARRAFEAAIRANPWNCTAYNELGLLSRQNGDFQAAEAHYLGCIEKVPADGPANLNLGILYELYLGRLKDALVYYRNYQSLQSEPDRRVQGWVMDLERRTGV